MWLASYVVHYAEQFPDIFVAAFVFILAGFVFWFLRDIKLSGFFFVVYIGLFVWLEIDKSGFKMNRPRFEAYYLFIFFWERLLFVFLVNFSVNWVVQKLKLKVKYSSIVAFKFFVFVSLLFLCSLGPANEIRTVGYRFYAYLHKRGFLKRC